MDTEKLTSQLDICLAFSMLPDVLIYESGGMLLYFHPKLKPDPPNKGFIIAYSRFYCEIDGAKEIDIDPPFPNSGACDELLIWNFPRGCNIYTELRAFMDVISRLKLTDEISD